MFEIVLHQPEIPPNTGNILRLCGNSGCRLHLVGPLGFSLRNKDLSRAGLDYAARVTLTVYDGWAELARALPARRWYAVTTRGARRYDEVQYLPGDVLVFGSESAGLPDAILGGFAPEMRLRIPMVAGSRTLNLANAVAVVVYEAWRQLGYAAGN